MEINVEVFSSPRQYETNEHKKTKPIEICWPNQRKKKAKNQKPKKKKKIFPNRSRLARTGSERTKKNDQSKSADPIKETKRPKTQK